MVVSVYVGIRTPRRPKERELLAFSLFSPSISLFNLFVSEENRQSPASISGQLFERREVRIADGDGVAFLGHLFRRNSSLLSLYLLNPQEQQIGIYFRATLRSLSPRRSIVSSSLFLDI